MTKRTTKTPTIIEAIRHKSLFGSLPAFQSLETWTGWLVWLNALFALPMDENELAIYRQCTGRTEAPKLASNEVTPSLAGVAVSHSYRR